MTSQGTPVDAGFSKGKLQFLSKEDVGEGIFCRREWRGSQDQELYLRTSPSECDLNRLQLFVSGDEFFECDFRRLRVSYFGRQVQMSAVFTESLQRCAPGDVFFE